MAAKKTNSGKSGNLVKDVPKFGKEQILGSAKYENRRDLVDALLLDEKEYTIAAVNNLIEKYEKGQVK